MSNKTSRQMPLPFGIHDAKPFPATLHQSDRISFPNYVPPRIFYEIRTEGAPELLFEAIAKPRELHFQLSLKLEAAVQPVEDIATQSAASFLAAARIRWASSTEQRINSAVLLDAGMTDIK